MSLSSFLDGGGVAASMIRERDWSDHPLGRPESWPPALRVALSIVLNSPESMILAWGPELHFFFNDTYFPLLGPRLPTAMGERFDHVWADGWAQAQPIIDEALAGRGQRFVNLPWTLGADRGAEATWWTFSYSRILDADGSVAGLFIVTNETTAQVLSDQRLAAERDRLSQMFEQGPSFMALLRGPDHVFELANPAYLRLVGHRQVIGRTMAEVLPDAVEQGYLALVDRVFETGEAFSAVSARYDIRAEPGAPANRRFVDIVYQPLTDAAGAVSGIFIEGADVTDRALAQEATRASDDRYRQIVEGALDFAIVTLDDHGIIDGWNSGAAQLTGHDAEEAVGRPGSLFFTPEDVAASVPDHEMNRASTEGRAVDERWHLRKDGSRFWGSGQMMTRPGGGYVKMFRDRTAEHEAERRVRELNETLEAQVRERTEALRASEEALRQSQKLDAMGQLTGGVAHDFNNLLTIIRSSVDYLKRDDLSDERRQRYVAAISDTVDRAATLTSQLLSFARRQPLKPEVFDVGERVRSIAELIRPLVGGRVAIRVQGCAEPCHAQADISQFETALVNLSVNARDAMDGEGELSFSIQEVSSLPAIRGHTHAEGDFIAIAVADTGAGIAPDQIANIFEPFFTTKDVGKGTGLGLSQVFGFAKQAGGEVEVRSEPGRGATFTLYLPRAAGPDGAAEMARIAEPAPSKLNLRILVVEDNEAVGAFANEMLRDLGYQTTWVGHAAAALALLAEDDTRFDVVFSDVVMPGMNGVELARTVRERHGDLPVILTSGYSTVLAGEGRYGFELLQKPYSVDALSQVLDRTISSRR